MALQPIRSRRAASRKKANQEERTCMLGLIKKFGCLAAAAALLVSAGANAENCPSKPVHILVPYAAGGAVDVLARTLGHEQWSCHALT
jgi:hypothetical protein